MKPKQQFFIFHFHKKIESNKNSLKLTPGLDSKLKSEQLECMKKYYENCITFKKSYGI